MILAILAARATTTLFGERAIKDRRPIQRPNGLQGNLPRLAVRNGRPNALFGIMTLFAAQFSPAGFVPWAFVTSPLRLAHPGKMGTRNVDWLAPPGMP
jgi:hypothetical protein